MSARPLSEVMQQAEAAITGKDFNLAVETCRRVLGQFPEFATAYRLLGEAYLEQGDNASAEQNFHEALQRDPQSLAAYAGLATVAENRGELQSALAYSQVAWEIAPQRMDLRDQVTRLSEKLYGAGGRLQLTRAALASLHYHGGRWSRAAAESAAVLSEYPGRVDVQLRLAEALWRRGSDDAAANTCRAILDQNPNVVVALLILADIERRSGNRDSAASLLSRARTVDPDGVRAADLIMVGSNDLADFLLPSESPVLEDQPEAAVEPERPRIAPAPDFSTPPLPVAPQAVDAADLPDEGMPDLTLPDDEEINAARPPGSPQAGYTDVLQSLEHEGLAPFSFGDDETPDEPETSSAALEEDLFSLASNDDIEAARPPEEQVRGYTSLLRSLDEGGLEPFAIDEPAEPGTETAPAAEIEASDLFEDLEQELQPEPEIADAPEPETTEPDSLAALTSDWDAIDQEIQRAIPGATPSGFTSELRALDETGIEPFNFEPDASLVDDADIDSAESDTSMDMSAGGDEVLETETDLAAHTSEPAAAASMEAASEDLMVDWDSIDQEILGAIPGDSTSGVTDELRALDESGLEPFSFDDLAAASPEAETVPTVDELMEDIFEDDQPDPVSVEAEASPDMMGGISETDLLGLDELEGDQEDDLLVDSPAWTEPEPAFEPGEPEAAAGAVFDTDIGAGTDAGIDLELNVHTEAPAEQEFELEQVAALGADMPSTSGDEAKTAASDTSSMQKLYQAISRLGIGADLFERARQAKAALVQSGQIEGEAYLPGTEPKGPTLDELLEMVEQNPEDNDARWALSQSLADAGEHGRALEEYRWLFRKAGVTSDELIAGVNALAETGGEVGLKSHRLLGALHRQSGNLVLSANHYQLSLEAYRQLRAGR